MANPKSKKRRKIIIFTVIGLVLVAMTLLAIFKKRAPVLRVETDKVSRQDITELVLANGRIQPVVQVKISAEVSGEIIALPVKEGQKVKKGDLLVKIRPDTYLSDRKAAEATYLSVLSGQALAEANLRKADLEFKRNESLFQHKLISDSDFLTAQTGLDIAKAQLESAKHQVDVTKGSLAKTDEELAKTTIYSPIDGTVSRLSAELGERVVGTALMTGTGIMTVADLSAMDARVEVGETDVVLAAPGQTASLEVDAFRDRKFQGSVTEIANMTRSSLGGMGGGGGGSSGSSDATRFEVRIRFDEPEAFRPGMSVNAEIRTRSRTNVLAVPVQSVTTRPPKPTEQKDLKAAGTNAPGTNVVSTNLVSTNVATASTKAAPARRKKDLKVTSTKAPGTNVVSTNLVATNAATTNAAPARRKKDSEKPKPIKVVFVAEGDHVKMVPVKVGINDQDYAEILEGLTEGQEVVSGSFKAVNKELEDGKKISRKKASEKKEAEKKETEKK